MANLGTTNGEILGWDGFCCDASRVKMVVDTVKERFLSVCDGVEYADDLNVFIKQEPHSYKKIDEGRLRLISGVSLIDALVDRVLFRWLMINVVNNVYKTPCMIGWAPSGGGWRFLWDMFRHKPVLCLDKSSWDWTVQAHMIKMWEEFVLELAEDHPPWYATAVKTRFKMLFDKAIFRFKDGTRVEQAEPGIMKSGCYLTIFLNSISQSYLHNLAMQRMGIPMKRYAPLTMGDDTIQESHPWPREYVKHLESFGCKIKGLKVKNYIEFCGFTINDHICRPAYWKKHLFKIQFAKDLFGTLTSYQVQYANDRLMLRFYQLLARQFWPSAYLHERVAKALMNGY